MADYCRIVDGVINNIIVCENDEVASHFNALPYYQGAKVGDLYSPPSAEDLVWDELARALKEGVNS